MAAGRRCAIALAAVLVVAVGGGPAGGRADAGDASAASPPTGKGEGAGEGGAPTAAPAEPRSAAPPSAPRRHEDEALEELGEELRDALAIERLLGLALRLLLLVVALQLLERLVRALVRWRVGLGSRLVRWLPALRLAGTGIAILIVVTAFTPDEPVARALVVAGVVVAVLWAARDVLRNAAAGAIVIARRAVREGDHVAVGSHAGRVRSVTLRGLELESPDGTRTYVPGVMLHTSTTTHAPGAGSTPPVTVRWKLPDDAEPSATLPEGADPESVRTLARRLALLSPRRAPNTPVLVALDEEDQRLRITVTPFDRDESDALRAELSRRLKNAFAPSTAGTPEQPTVHTRPAARVSVDTSPGVDGP